MKSPVLRMLLITLAGVTLLAAIMTGSSLMIRRGVVEALSRFDSRAAVRGITVSPGALILTGVSFPSRGVRADSAWILLQGFPLRTEPVHVVLTGATVIPFHHSRDHAPGSVGELTLPPVSILEGVLITGNQESALFARAHHGRILFELKGPWGDAWGVSRDEDSLSVVFRNCVSLPGIGGFPPILAGNSFCGTMKGRYSGTSAELEGSLTGFNGSPMNAGFSLVLNQGRPSFEISMDFRQIAPQAAAIIDSLSGGVVTRADPSGTFRVATLSGDSLGFSFDLAFDSLELYSPALASDTVRFRCRFTGEGVAKVEAGHIRISSGTVFVGSAGANYEFLAEWGSGRELRLRLYNDSLPGHDLASSIPEPMLGRLRGLRLSGSVGFDIGLVLNWVHPDSSDVSIRVSPERLRVEYSPITFGRLAAGSGETVRMRDSWGNSRIVGLDSLACPDFVYSQNLSPWLEPLLCAAEDGTFRRHRGFSEYHIRNSIRADMSQGRFARGGSTITMQLVKNLFLTREKTFARKLQEVYLTWRIEAHLSKDRILELYANVVEMGPDVFGFREAADYYFGSTMEDLSVREAAFLVSILPGPRIYHRFGVQGFVPQYWNSYLDRLIRAAENRTGLSAFRARHGLSDSLVFRGRVSGHGAGFSPAL